MSKMGSIIRKIRLSKGITQSKLSENILSVTALSNFEREQNDISSEKFMRIIDRLNISLHEVNILITELDNSNQRKYITKLSLAENEDNIVLLKKLHLEQETLFNTSKNMRHKHNSIIAKQTINKLNNDPYDLTEVKQINEYLRNLDDWNYYEISLFSNSIFFLPLDLIIYFSNYMIQKTIKYSDSLLYRKDIAILLSNILLLLIEKEELIEAQSISHILKEYLDGTTFYYEIIRYQFIEGLLLIRQNNNETGMFVCKKSIEQMNTLGDYSNSRAYNKYLVEFVGV